MKEVLFVDDESALLQGLRRMLRSMRKEWNMRFVCSGQEALELIQKQHFDVVVSDMRMPGMDGAELLGRIRERDPGIARIVLSGQTDKEAVMRSTATAHQFLSKPCTEDQLKGAIRRACQIRELMKNEDIQKLVSGLPSLPSMPAVYEELCKELGNEDLSLQRIGDIVSRDLALTAKILQLANSSFFNFPHDIESVNQAVSLLGTEIVNGLVLSSAVFSQFEGDIDGFQLERLWRHSRDCAAVSTAIAGFESDKKPIADQSFQAGMLHDIGRLVLAAGLPSAYEETIDIADSENVPIHVAEVRLIGCDHSQIGAYLMGLWGLPDPIVEAIAYHHNPQEAVADEFSPLTVVHAGNCLANMLQPNEAHVVERARADLKARVNDDARMESWIRVARRVLDSTDTALAEVS